MILLRGAVTADRRESPGRDPWTKEEDDQLWGVFQSLGNKWHAISSTLDGRPGWWIFLFFYYRAEG